MPRSGATPWAKEDLVDGVFLYQHKQMMPETKSHSVKKEDLENLRHHALDADKQPCYIIEYDNRRWFMILEDTFNEIDR